MCSTVGRAGSDFRFFLLKIETWIVNVDMVIVTWIDDYRGLYFLIMDSEMEIE